MRHRLTVEEQIHFLPPFWIFRAARGRPQRQMRRELRQASRKKLDAWLLGLSGERLWLLALGVVFLLCGVIAGFFLLAGFRPH